MGGDGNLMTPIYLSRGLSELPISAVCNLWRLGKRMCNDNNDVPTTDLVHTIFLMKTAPKKFHCVIISNHFVLRCNQTSHLGRHLGPVFCLQEGGNRVQKIRLTGAGIPREKHVRAVLDQPQHVLLQSVDHAC